MTAVAPRTRQVLGVLIDFIARTDTCPSYRQMGMMLGITRTAVQHHVDALVAAGFLRREPWEARSLEVVRLPGQGLTAAEFAWCQDNAARVRAMMQVTGDAPQPAAPVREATAAPVPAVWPAERRRVRAMIAVPGDAS